MKMEIAISGASGLVGSALSSHLKENGHKILRLVREKESSPDAIYWDPANQEIDARRLEGVDAVINLAGENIASGTWNSEKKRKIRDSRVQSTQLLANTVASLTHPPKVFLNASAIGFYGKKNREVKEGDLPGDGFLADVCMDWEAATAPVKAAGVRLVLLRFGMILSEKGGALKKMLVPFKLGLGGRVGSGNQSISWIAIDDLCRAIEFCLSHTQIEGPVNIVAPHPCSNNEFTTALGKALNRPTLVPLPAFIAKLAFGEMAEELLLNGVMAYPKKLQEAGFHFHHKIIDDALAEILN